MNMASKKQKIAAQHFRRENSEGESDDDDRNGLNKTNGFVKGAIVRIRMVNFVTYDDCEVFPGPHLNMIVGPNGTGKSSLVCAICLGLAGPTSLLGRAKEIGEYVKYGEDTAIVEIELYQPDRPNLKIKRDIQRRDNRSTWTLNGKSCGVREIQSKVASLNIQISNLCQFLPQDMVVEFAKMTPIELLENTEKAVGKMELSKAHQKLKDCRKNEKNLQALLQEAQDNHKAKVQRNGRLREDVERFKRRREYMDTIEILEKKRAWVEYDQKRLEYLELKKKKSALEESVQKLKQQNNPMQRRLDAIMEEIERLDQQMRQKTTSCRQASAKASNKHDQLKNLDEDIQEVMEEMKEKKLQELKRKKKINDWKALIDGWQKELDEMPPDDDLKPQLEKNSKEHKLISHESRQIQIECTNIQSDRAGMRREIQDCEKRLKQLNDLRDQRLRSLRQSQKDCYDAVIWLRSNKDRFRGVVHEPVLLTLNIGNKDHTKFFEHAIAQGDRFSFICEENEDLQLFLTEVREAQGLRVNAVKSPREHLSSFRPEIPIDRLRRFGFSSYLLDLCEAPESVLAYLCKWYKIHTIPVGDGNTEQNAERVIAETGLRKFFTPETCYSIKHSRYGNRNKSTQSVQVSGAQQISASVDMGAKRELEAQLQEVQAKVQRGEQRYKDLNSKIKELSAQENTLKEQKRELLQRRDRRKTITQHIKAKQEAIQVSEAEAFDSAAEEGKAKKKIQQVLNKKCQLIRGFQALVKEYGDQSKEKVISTMKYALKIKQKSILETKMRDSTAHLQLMEDELRTLQNLSKDAKEKAKTLLRTAQQRTGAEGPSAELKRYFAEFPSTLEELDNKIHETRASADCLFEVGESVMEEYENREKKIKRLEELVVERKRNLEQHQSEIVDLKGSWLTDLKELISRINVKFSEFFAGMGCAGEVALEYENEEDFDKYGVNILVKFRDSDELRELTSHYQSGGERSVSTILYLMALQELNKCPFRVVDEINQGMDTANERKVFEFVVQTACRENTPQYFLITPKLLPNLHYGPKMKVLCVMNGHWMLPYKEWDVDRFCRIRREIE